VKSVGRIVLSSVPDRPEQTDRGRDLPYRRASLAPLVKYRQPKLAADLEVPSRAHGRCELKSDPRRAHLRRASSRRQTEARPVPEVVNPAEGKFWKHSGSFSVCRPMIRSDNSRRANLQSAIGPYVMRDDAGQSSTSSSPHAQRHYIVNDRTSSHRHSYPQRYSDSSLPTWSKQTN
jgi:hypothetical protein